MPSVLFLEKWNTLPIGKPTPSPAKREFSASAPISRAVHGMVLSGMVLSGMVLSGMVLSGMVLSGMILSGTVLSGMVLSFSSFSS